MTYSPGDKVYVISHHHGTRIDTVDRVTKTQVVVGMRRFRLSDGREVGIGGWRPDRIEPITSKVGASEYEATRCADARVQIAKAAASCKSLEALESALSTLRGAK